MTLKKMYALGLVGMLLSCGEHQVQKDSVPKAIIPASEVNEFVLGQGTNADTHDRLENCVEMEDASYEPADGQPANITDISPTTNLILEVKSISSYTDIDKFTDISVSANIKTASYGGGFSYDQTKEYALTSDTAMVGIRASADYGRWYQKEPKVKDEYLKIYKSNPSEFFRRCGTEFVSGYKLGQGIKVLLSTAQKSTYDYERISANVNASAQVGAGSGSFNASFLSVASSLLKMGSLQIEVRSYSSEGLDTYKGLIRSEADVSELSTQISNIVSQMKPSKAVRFQFLTSAYPGIDPGDFKTSAIMREHRAMVLGALFNDYRRLAQDLTRANSLVTYLPSMVEGWGSLCDYATPKTGSCSDFITKMNGLRDNLSSAIGKIDELAKQCSLATKVEECKTSDAADVRVNDLVIKTWEQQYKASLRDGLLLAGLNPVSGG